MRFLLFCAKTYEVERSSVPLYQILHGGLSRPRPAHHPALLFRPVPLHSGITPSRSNPNAQLCRLCKHNYLLCSSPAAMRFQRCVVPYSAFPALFMTRFPAEACNLDKLDVASWRWEDSGLGEFLFAGVGQVRRLITVLVPYRQTAVG